MNKRYKLIDADYVYLREASGYMAWMEGEYMGYAEYEVDHQYRAQHRLEGCFEMKMALRFESVRFWDSSKSHGDRHRPLRMAVLVLDAFAPSVEDHVYDPVEFLFFALQWPYNLSTLELAALRAHRCLCAEGCGVQSSEVVACARCERVCDSSQQCRMYRAKDRVHLQAKRVRIPRPRRLLNLLANYGNQLHSQARSCAVCEIRIQDALCFREECAAAEW